MYSLRRYLFVRLLVFVIPLVAGASALHWHLEKGHLLHLFDLSLTEKAMALATLVTGEPGEWELDFADEYMPHYSVGEDTHYFQIWLPDGRSLERSVSLGEQGELPRRIGPVDEPERFWADLEGGRRIRCTGIRFPYRQGHGNTGSPVHQVDVVVAADESLLTPALGAGRFEIILMAMVTTGSIALVMFMILRQGSRHLRRLARQVEGLDLTSQNDALQVERSPLEIQPIVKALNHSIEAVLRSMDNERRFAGDVAHELRTPISELRMAVEVAREWPDDESRREALECAYEVAVRMSSLVESLLSLARLESLHGETPRRSFDVAEALQQTLSRVKGGQAKGPEDRISYRGPRHLEASVNPDLWEIITGNLLSNALEYSPPGSVIDVELEAREDAVCFRVLNLAPDLGPVDVEHFCDRLWRKDASRTSKAHTGLGLSIVQAACVRSGATLQFHVDHGTLSAEVILLRTEPAEIVICR